MQEAQVEARHADLALLQLSSKYDSVKKELDIEKNKNASLAAQVENLQDILSELQGNKLQNSQGAQHSPTIDTHADSSIHISEHR